MFSTTRRISFVLFIVTTAATAVLADTVYPTTPQPTTIPGNFFISSVNLPDASTIIANVQHNELYAGVYAWWGTYATERNDAQQVKWKSLRAGGAAYDSYVRNTVEDGLTVVATLSARVGGVSKDRTDFNTDQEYIDALIASISSFLDRYGPGGSFFTDNPQLDYRPVLYVEILNEPNFQYMLPNDDNLPRLTIEAMREALYAQVLIQTYAHIKANWPDVQVVGFGAGGSASADTRFIQHVLEQDPQVANSFDIVSTHPYTQPEPPEVHCSESWGSYNIINNFNTIRNTLAQHGRSDAPIWYTEVGWKISYADGGTFTDTAGSIYVTPELQAAYVCRLYALGLRMNVKSINIMYIHDSDGFNGGFFKNGGPWRPSAYAAQYMIDLMPNPKLTGVISEGTTGNWIYKFSPGTDTSGQSKPDIIMAWKVQGPEVVDIPCDSDTVAVVDMYGNQQIVTVPNNTLSVEIGPLPIYILPPYYFGPSVLARNIFYNNSSFDNNNPAVNTDDDLAIAIDKKPLYPGQTATFENYTSYMKGINGLMIDINDLPGQPDASDFEFKFGNNEFPQVWDVAPAPTAITVRPGAGVGGSDRITITFADNAIMNNWLQVTVKATANTGLAEPDLFYFGNTPGETGDNPNDTLVNATDEINTRNNPRHFHRPAPIDFPYDHNRDGKVDATDEIICRNNPMYFANSLILLSP